MLLARHRYVWDESEDGGPLPICAENFFLSLSIFSPSYFPSTRGEEVPLYPLGKRSLESRFLIRLSGALVPFSPPRYCGD